MKNRKSFTRVALFIYFVLIFVVPETPMTKQLHGAQIKVYQMTLLSFFFNAVDAHKHIHTLVSVDEVHPLKKTCSLSQQICREENKSKRWSSKGTSAVHPSPTLISCSAVSKKTIHVLSTSAGFFSQVAKVTYLWRRSQPDGGFLQYSSQDL